jgi:phosphate transport system substrate-binding protein
MRKSIVFQCLLLIVGVSLIGTLSARLKIDADLAEYERVEGVSGSLTSVGSDTMAKLVTLWAEAFKTLYPEVTLQVQAAGSSTAPIALNDGRSQIGPMSRRMVDAEVGAFEQRHGYKPTPVAVAIDALAVFVSKENPIRGLTLQQLDAIFSADRACGGEEAITRWGQLGLEAGWDTTGIRLFGRNSISGTHYYFRQHALCQGEFRDSVEEKPGSATVVRSVSNTLNGIGYSGIAYANSSARALPLARSADRPFIEATPENAIDGSYPFARFLYVYIDLPPDQPLEPVVREFLSLVLSREGQEIVAKSGYVPLPASVADREREKFALPAVPAVNVESSAQP